MRLSAGSRYTARTRSVLIVPFLVFTHADNDTVEEFHVPVTDTPGVYEP